MISGCENHVGSMTRIGSPASAPSPGPGHLRRPQGTDRHLLRRRKKRRAGLRSIPADLLRQQVPAHPRPVLWRHPGVPGGRGSPRPLPTVWRGETGKAPLAGRQPLLHQALCLLRRPALPHRDDPGRGPRTAPRLEDRQGSGNGVHGRATPSRRHARPDRHRHRRNLHPQGAHLPDRRHRPAARPADLVRRHGPLRGEHGPVLPGLDHGNAGKSAWR